MKNFIDENCYEAMIMRLRESRNYGRDSRFYDEEEWCLRDDPDFDDVRVA